MPEHVIPHTFLKLKQCDSRIAEQKEAVDREILSLQKKTENNRRFLTGLYESFTTGILTRAGYLEMKEGYSREIEKALECVRQL